ncbi:MAG: hypothetical protein M3299_00085 [Thermoproteota archaeon]|nr:hypothetical protein [Thermoproteota archaeon]
MVEISKWKNKTTTDNDQSYQSNISIMKRAPTVARKGIPRNVEYCRQASMPQKRVMFH